MSQAATPPTDPKPAPKNEIPSRIFLVSYPKVIFLYPTFLVTLVGGILLSIMGENNLAEPSITQVMITSVFLGVLAMNLFVFSFDFPRTTSLTLFFFIASAIFGGFLLYQSKPEWFGFLSNLLGKFHPVANSTFFHIVTFLLGLIYLAVLVSVQFDYWEVRPNELLHHHGLLSDLKRFSAPTLTIDKEINDVFEFMLLRSGRLILHPSNEPRAIVLENVLFIDRKEQQITRMLGALQVQIRTDNQ